MGHRKLGMGIVALTVLLICAFCFPALGQESPSSGWINVEAATVDPAGNILSGGSERSNNVGFRANGIPGWQDGGSPTTFVLVDGGQYDFSALWGGLGLVITDLVIDEGYTYYIDAMTEALTIAPSPGETRVLAIYEPIEIVIQNVDPQGNLLSDLGLGVNRVDIGSVYHTFWNTSGTSPITFTVANGGIYRFEAIWGGLESDWCEYTQILEGNRYQMDAGTREISVLPAGGQTIFEIVFEPIFVTVLNVDQFGDLLPPNGTPSSGRVQAAAESGKWTATGFSPMTYEQANGGRLRFSGWWDGYSEPTDRFPVCKDTTYSFDVGTKVLSSEATPGVIEFRFIWSTNSPPEAVAGSSQTLEADAPLGGHATLDGSGSTDDGIAQPLSFNWTWEGGSAAGCNPTVFLPLGDNAVTLTVYDGEFTDTDSVLITVQDTTAPEISCPSDLILDVDDPNAEASYEAWLLATTATDICDPTAAISHDAPLFAELAVEGTTGVGTSITWKATDASGNVATCSSTVKLLDTTPPELAITLTPNVLWPPNHKLVRITVIASAVDNSDPAPIVELVSIESNESDEAADGGDGHTHEDIQDTAFGNEDLEFYLRAERLGASDARVYTITYSATDAYGNVAYICAEVVVPHSAP
ncbi:HYR domain-containing protein [Candidatus Bipolaricaulota bacterium]|nr:HYR domain-containing protein [Candidatus Bipolaricaulota bacterium]